jgi:acetolactate synthase small subunit
MYYHDGDAYALATITAYINERKIAFDRMTSGISKHGMLTRMTILTTTKKHTFVKVMQELENRYELVLEDKYLRHILL